MVTSALKVVHAKEILKRLGGKGCVIILFDENDGVAVAEYGKDRVECGKLKKLVDAIVDQLEDGRLPAP